MKKKQEWLSSPIHTKDMHSMRDAYYHIAHFLENNNIIILLSFDFQLH